MTSYRDKAIWELRRQGYHAVADEAQVAWARGDGYTPRERLPLARELMEFIRIANWETGRKEAA
jgi:hypothetical protein